MRGGVITPNASSDHGPSQKQRQGDGLATLGRQDDRDARTARVHRDDRPLRRRRGRHVLFLYFRPGRLAVGGLRAPAPGPGSEPRFLPPGLSSRQTAESIWNRYIDWGAANPDAYSTINQLLASDRLTAGQLRRAETLYLLPEIQACRRRFAGLTDREAWALSDATEKAIADTTVRLAVAQPQHAEAYKMAGFDMLCRGDAGADHPGLSQPAGEYFTRGTRLSST